MKTQLHSRPENRPTPLHKGTNGFRRTSDERRPVFSRAALLASILLVFLPIMAPAQNPGLTVPPPGANQSSVVTQHMGLVAVTIEYNSPDVTSPTGEDRTGKIWGQLVPYGMVNLGFGSCGDTCPWRVGANENTVFEVSHDVTVEGQPLPAGRYGLHMVPGEEEWTMIFSRNAESWGSFFYDPAEDQLRVTVTAEPAEFREWLTFDFLDRQLDSTLVALHWENLRVPFRVEVPDIDGLYLAKIRKELRNSPGFSWQNWNAAAQFCAQRSINLEEALEWSEQAISNPFFGQSNFTTLSTQAQVLAALERQEEAEKRLFEAVDHPTATVFQIHGLGRTLIGMEDGADLALRVFQRNADLHPDTWPVHVGLTRGHSAVGDFEQALVHVRKAIENAPDELNRTNLESMIPRLEAGEDIN